VASKMLRSVARFVRSWLFASVLALPTTVAAAPSAASSIGTRLEDAVHWALTRNERGKISDLSVLVADAAVERARAGFLPVVTALGPDQQHAYAATDKSPNNIGNASLTVSQPIINASAYPLYSQAKNLAKAQVAQNVDDKRLLAFTAATAFFAVLNAQDVAQAAQEQLDTAKANLADTQARTEAGLNSTNDVTRAHVDTASAAREVEIDKGALDNSLVQLEFVVNSPVVDPLIAPSATLSAAEQPIGAIAPLVSFALTHRPDVVASKYAALAAHDFAGEPLLRIVPTLTLQGQVTGTTNPASSGRWSDEVLQATLAWTLYDAGVRYADKHSRDAQAQITDLSLAQLARSVESQIRGAIALLAAAQAAFGVAQDAVAASRQSVEETAILYRQGLAKAIELVDANDQRFLAEVNSASAEFAVAQTYLSLRQALGLGPLEDNRK
jgi:outer membrane protein TolC